MKSKSPGNNRQRVSTSLIVGNQFDVAADLIGLDRPMRKLLLMPSRSVSVEVPVRMDDGTLEVFRGYRIQHSGARGPCKGGVRYHPEADEEEVLGLATTMTWKTALLDIPFGGAKGGVQVKARDLSLRELEAVTRQFTRRIAIFLGPYQDIPAPDMNTNAQVMAWMLDEYSQKFGYSPAAVTGKPVALGGSLGREEATGRGAFLTMKAYSKDSGIALQGSRVVIQGFGNVGSHLAMFLHDHGAKVIAVGDVFGGLHNEDGLDVPALFQHAYLQHLPVAEFSGGDVVQNDHLLNIPCEWLVPAALGSVISKEKNADTLDCKVIVEAANSPVTPIAEKILEARDIQILPDFLVNAGGVVVSYFEWTQNLQQEPWSLERVNNGLEKKMSVAYEAVRDLADKTGVPWRTAALAIALRRVADAETLRGGH